MKRIIPYVAGISIALAVFGCATTDKQDKRDQGNSYELTWPSKNLYSNKSSVKSYDHFRHIETKNSKRDELEWAGNDGTYIFTDEGCDGSVDAIRLGNQTRVRKDNPRLENNFSVADGYFKATKQWLDAAQEDPEAAKSFHINVVKKKL